MGHTASCLRRSLLPVCCSWFMLLYQMWTPECSVALSWVKRAESPLPLIATGSNAYQQLTVQSQSTPNWKRSPMAH